MDWLIRIHTLRPKVWTASMVFEKEDLYGCLAIHCMYKYIETPTKEVNLIGHSIDALFLIILAFFSFFIQYILFILHFLFGEYNIKIKMLSKMKLISIKKKRYYFKTKSPLEYHFSFLSVNNLNKQIQYLCCLWKFRRINLKNISLFQVSNDNIVW